MTNSLICNIPEQLHPGSEILLRAWKGEGPGDTAFDALIATHEPLCSLTGWLEAACSGFAPDKMFEMYFHIFNSDYMGVAQCLIDLRGSL